MANFKSMDDHDFVFINKPLTLEQEKEFSYFLKNRKKKIKPTKKLRTQASQKGELA
jgi:hypothetical protein